MRKAASRSDPAGYRDITVAPVVPAALDHVSATQDTVRGRVASTWHRTAAGLRLTVVVPANSHAVVQVPLLAEGDRVRAPAGARRIHSADRSVSFQVGSGSWTFTAG